MSAAFLAAIFDVDGVLVDSPHERAWREALAGFADPAGFTTAFYQAHVAGKPRLAGSLHDAGLKLALASSSRNAEAMLRQISLPDGRTLLSVFDADLSGRDVPYGKPDPALFLLAAQALGVPPARTALWQDAPSGIEAARAGAMAALGVARLHDEALLHDAGAELVLTSLDQFDIAALAKGAVHARPIGETASHECCSIPRTQCPRCPRWGRGPINRGSGSSWIGLAFAGLLSVLLLWIGLPETRPLPENAARSEQDGSLFNPVIDAVGNENED